MRAIINTDFKRIWWLWVVIVISIFLLLFQGIYGFQPAIEKSKTELQLHEQRGDLDPLKALEIKKMWRFPYFFSSTILSNIILLISILILLTSPGLISRETERKTIQLLLSFPVSRFRLLVGKFMAGEILIGITLFITYGLMCVLAFSVGLSVNLAATATLFALHLIQFSAIHGYSFMLSVLQDRYLTSAGLSSIISFILFLNSLVGKAGYIDSGSVLSGYGFSYEMPIAMIVSTTMFFTFSALFFKFKELG